MLLYTDESRILQDTLNSCGRHVSLTKLIKMAGESKSPAPLSFIEFWSRPLSFGDWKDLPAILLTGWLQGLFLICRRCYYFFIIVYCTKSTSFSPEGDCAQSHSWEPFSSQLWACCGLDNVLMSRLMSCQGTISRSFPCYSWKNNCTILMQFKVTSRAFSAGL